MTVEQTPDVEGYISILQKKTVGDIPIYAPDVLANIMDRTDYLPQAIELQRRADAYIRDLGEAFQIEGKNTPSDIQAALTNKTLGVLKARTKEVRAAGGSPKFFVALAGPGGAGKDTVFENTEEQLQQEGRTVARVFKYTTREATRAGAYHFASDVQNLHGQLGDLPITDEEAVKIKETFGIDSNNNLLTLSELEHIQDRVDAGNGTLEEWNLNLDPTKTSLVEFLYRRHRGWYATDGQEIVDALQKADVAVITGNPQNLAVMVERVRKENPDIISLMVYVLPAYPSQFTSAARAIARDGISQDTKSLLSTTGPRQTGEMGLFVDLVTTGRISRDNVVILENDALLSDPKQSGKIETLAGKQLADALLCQP